ncbi:50S ribosomal protein L23 [Patescibacteria group bacterium]|nr:50S ribosomal protein L23 [Patescibacteria group bacterium]MCL5010569.1 50S ribosomal protein L23 [Patescibacteria group bacterium]
MKNVLISPIITEKSMRDTHQNKFTFKVNKKADKTNIRKAVEKTFNVHALSVATSVVKGGRKRIGQRRTEVSVSPWKKAIVKLKEGEKIDLFDQAR